MIGGGYSMLPLIQREINTRWADKLVFSETLPLAQSLPGPFVVNLATLTGRAVAGFWGACLAVCGVSLPSLLVIGLISAAMIDWKTIPLLAAAMNGLRPVAIGLIAAALWRLRDTWLKGFLRPALASLTLILLSFKLVSPLPLVGLAVLAAGLHAWLVRKQP